MKQVIISGASAGIGAVTAARFVDAGWAVTNLSRRPCPVAGVTSIRCDFADPESVARVAADLRASVADADQVLLIHNASLLRNDRSGECDDASFREVLQINLAAPNTLNTALLPLMKPGSAVIYVGSTLSEKAVPNSASYVTTKHGTIGMMRATCQDLAGRGIHTACVCPGFTDTEMLRSHIGTDPATEAAVASMSAFGRLIKPEEIAETIVWAATHPVINGAVLHANLGQLER
ncbi:MAG: SDR family oxidoreductase [Gammaproteobacteria bacterium]|nr:SDR family oxidoreductase [Gammaproteobacteria bacterium]